MTPPAFQFYPDDFLGGTCDLTAEEVGAYIRLLAFQWTRGAIPSDPDRLARIAGCPVSAEVLAKFAGGKNARLERERAKQQAYRDEQRKKGEAGAKARWQNSPGHAPAMPAPCPGHDPAMPVPSSGHWPEDGSPSPSPSPSKHERESGRSALAERPSLAEVKGHAARIGLAPWKAEDWWNEMEGCGWLDFNHRPVANWQAVLNRVRTKWEADGRPEAPPASKPAQKPSAPRLGPSLSEVQSYAAEKDDGTKRAQTYAVAWWQAMEAKAWKDKQGHSIDWKIEFARRLQDHLQRQP